MYPSNLILIVVVACLNVKSSAARPYESDGTNAHSNNGLFNYKLATDLTNKMVIIINGTLNKNHKMFTAKFPSLTDSPGSDCTFSYDFQAFQLKITPASSPDRDSSSYYMENKNTSFNLRLKARDYAGNPIIDFKFEGGDGGPSEILACKINQFQDVNEIVFEGVENVDNLLFEFPK